MPFTGQADAVIDAKQRLALPAKFRAKWNPASDGVTWMALPWVPDKTLRIYTERMFEELFRAGRASPSLFASGDEARLEQAVFSATERLEVDQNHRVRVPAWQIEKLGLPREVVVIGAGDRLEVHPRNRWHGGFDAMLGEIGRLAERRNRGDER